MKFIIIIDLIIGNLPYIILDDKNNSERDSSFISLKLADTKREVIL